MANKYEFVADYTKLAFLMELGETDAVKESIYLSLAAANGTTPEQEREKILKTLNKEKEA